MATTQDQNEQMATTRCTTRLFLHGLAQNTAIHVGLSLQLDELTSPEIYCKLSVASHIIFQVSHQCTAILGIWVILLVIFEAPTTPSTPSSCSRASLHAELMRQRQSQPEHIGDWIRPDVASHHTSTWLHGGIHMLLYIRIYT